METPSTSKEDLYQSQNAKINKYGSFYPQIEQAKNVFLINKM